MRSTKNSRDHTLIHFDVTQSPGQERFRAFNMHFGISPVLFLSEDISP